MGLRGGEFSTGEMRNFHPALTVLLGCHFSRDECPR
jgi:hypothetical protein